MIKLPKKTRDPKETADLCKCRPVCKSRRRTWKGKTQNTSAELLLERKPIPECFKRYPTRMYPNSPCPIFFEPRRLNILERGVDVKPDVVRICQAPLDIDVDTPYLKYARLAKQIGAWDAVKTKCLFCNSCTRMPITYDYIIHDEERSSFLRKDMRKFDARIKNNYQTMRIMYDKP